jgi:chromate reductase, NAD(P)H dehydrogenase (quinone)
MSTVIGVSGSLRSGSYNTGLLRAAVELAPAGLALEASSIREIPVYDGDVEESDGLPAAAAALKERIAAADGLLLVTPEYNHSLPGVLKNAIDWLSRPPKDIKRVFGGKPVGLIGATPGRGGTRFSQQAWLQVFRALGLVPYFGASVYLDGAKGAFEGNPPRLVDETVRELVTRYLAGFAAFVDAHR